MKYLPSISNPDLLLRRLFNVAWIVVCVEIGIFLAVMLMLSGNGLDLTDTSYYLSWSLFPKEHAYSLTWFGNILSVILLLCGNNVAVFSAVAVLLLFAAGTGLSYSAIRLLSLPEEPAEKSSWKVYLISMSGGIGFFAFYSLWILVPSYNWLALIAGCLICTGLFRLVTHMPAQKSWLTTRNLLTVLLLSFGFFFAFFAKFTTALIFGILAVFFIAVLWQRIKLHLLLAGMTLAIIALLFGGVHLFIKPLDVLLNDTSFLYQTYQENGSKLQVSSSAANDTDIFLQSVRPIITIISGLIGYSAGYLFKTLRHPDARWAKARFFIGPVTLFLMVLGLSRGHPQLFFSDLETFSRLLSLTAFSWAAFAASKGFSKQSAPWLKISAAGAILFVSAYAVQFGSQNDLRVMLRLASGFIVLAIALPWLTNPRSNTLAMPLALVLGLFAINLLSWTQTPYRLPGTAWQQNVPIQAPLLKGARFSSDMASDLQTFRDTALAAGLTPDTRVIDMTGQSPYLHLLLGTPPLAAPWIIGGEEPRRKIFVALVLDKLTPFEKRCAWVFHSNGSRAFSPEDLKGWGIPLNTRLPVAEYLGYPHVEGTTLYKPKGCE